MATAHRSFRDPAGAVAVTDDRVLRAVLDAGVADCTALLASDVVRDLIRDGALVQTRVIDPDAPANAAVAAQLFGFRPPMLLEHERIGFASYPYEWPSEMLHAAGTLTLRLARRLLGAGLGLKDGTPFNVLFEGPRPVFVDVLSVERREPGDALWLPEAQFIRTFVLPLLLHRRFGIPVHQIFLGSREGCTPEEAYRLAGWPLRLTPPFLRWSTLPTWLGRAVERQPAPKGPSGRTANADKARFILGMTLRRLERAMNRLTPAGHERSTWSEYEASTHYDKAAAAAKEHFVAAALERVRPGSVLDVGCNVGRFSRMAGKTGAHVVAVDLDPTVVGAVWRMAAAENLPIQPLVQNLAMPSPSTGWRNSECPSFLERAAGRFEMVFMLALVHHLMVTDRIPLDQIVQLAATLTRRAVVVEYVGPSDPMFRRIARGREHLHAGLSEATFEAAWTREFRLESRSPVPGTGRVLYHFSRGH